ncbi:MAG: tetratricopeptide repeat protein [Gammaproteobacteria bacterium]|nr:tetratricopeptide repeat protein [Gammaproteobacteria bacterium]
MSWIFQPVYLLFFAIIAALYIYRAEVIPEYRDIESSRALISKVEQTAAVINERSLTQGALPVNAEMEFGEDSSQPLAHLESIEVLSPEVAESINVVRPVEEEDFNDRENSSVNLPGERELAEPATSSVTVIEQSEPYVAIDEPQEVDQEGVEVVAQTGPVEQESSGSNEALGRLWYAARKAAWSGDYDQAIADYLQITSDYPDHADGFGELGNIYYALGDVDAAIKSYQQAINIYQTIGDSGQALQLQRVVTEIQDGGTKNKY